MKICFGRLIAIFWLVLCASASASSISVSPTTLNLVTSGEAGSSVTVTNSSTAPVNIQARALRWTQVDGRDRLDPTEEVAVSPPIIQVAPGADQVIRIVRLSQRPVTGEEAYRLLVDELPSSARLPATSVHLVVRQSIPVFFRSPEAAFEPLSFELSRAGNATRAIGINRGEAHQKITSLTIKDGHNTVRYSKNGLVGYVLGKSSFAWIAPTMGAGLASVQGRTEHGPINLSVELK
jgi:fimbrial chaperone protein